MKTAQDRLKFILDFAGVTPKPFAEIIGVKATIIQNINKGLQKTFPYHTAKAINKIFNFSIDWIMDGEGEIFTTAENTLERRTLNIDILLAKTNDIGKRFDFVRTINNLSIEEFIKILEITKERYLEICLENKIPNTKELILLKANFNIKIDDFLFDESNEIKKMIGDKSEFNRQISNLTPTQRAIIKKTLNK